MDIIKYNTITNLHDYFKNIVQNKEEGLYCLDNKNIVVYRGTNNPLNKYFCQNNQIDIIEFNHQGGVIVAFPGDISTALFSKNIDEAFNIELLHSLQLLLEKKGIKAGFSGNDLLIDNKYKVASYSSKDFRNIYYHALHISFHVDINLIALLCKKPMTKIPKGLDEYGITKEELWNFFENFCEEYQKHGENL